MTDRMDQREGREESRPAMRAAIAIKREYRPLSDSTEKLAMLIENNEGNTCSHAILRALHQFDKADRCEGLGKLIFWRNARRILQEYVAAAKKSI